ncbi:MAG: hypothetical protein U1A78_00995 [Polyangia bacterium]
MAAAESVPNPPVPGPPDAEPLTLLRGELAALRDKYELLLGLCRGEAGRTLARRDAMREVAARFPAALREWEQLPQHELERRHGLATALLQRLITDGGAAVAAVQGALAHEPALRFGASLHGYLRELLRVRRSLGPLRPDPGAVDAELLAACRRACDRDGEGPLRHIELSAALVCEVARPRGGRLSALAYSQVAAQHGVSVESIKAALFGAGERQAGDRAG